MLQSVTLVCLLAGALGGDVWPGFLGVGHRELAADTLPLRWSPASGIAWKTPLPGYGQSSPIVWHDLCFVTSVEGPNKERNLVMCLDMADGKERWRHVGKSSLPVKNSMFTSRAAPTPVVDDQGVYVFFESGDLIALTHEGKTVWERSLTKEFGPFKNEFGLGSSPAQDRDFIYLLLDDTGPSCVMALKKTDGTTVWKTERKPRMSWSSPALIPLDDATQLVCSSQGSVDGYNPATGKLLWSKEEVGGNSSATPLPVGEGEFLVAAMPGRRGENADKMRDSNLRLAIEKTAAGWQPRVAWKNAKVVGSFASPITYRDCAYWINSVGVLFCVNAQTGETLYTERLKQQSWATPLGVGDRVYFFGKDGLTTVIATGSKFHVLAENELWDPQAIKPPAEDTGKDEPTAERRKAAAMFAGPIQYGIAAVEGSLLIRTGEMLYCLRQPGK